MLSSVDAGKASTALVASNIPYRTTSAVSISDMAGASLITLFILVILVGFLIYARRRGWAMPGIASTKRIPNDADLSIVATRRLSIASVGYVVSYRGNEYLIVESGKGFQTAIVPLSSRDNSVDVAS